MRSVEGGYFASSSAARRGRAASSPPQLRHLPASTPFTQSRQYVHSKEQMNASGLSGGRSRLQHSQFGRSCSIYRAFSAATRKPLFQLASPTGAVRLFVPPVA